MKNNKNDVMEEYIKKTLPNVNWDYYDLIGIEKVKNIWKHQDIYINRMIVRIKEKTKIPKWLDQNLWYSHGYVTTTYDDRPIRDNAVTIVSQRKRWRHKETKKVINSKHLWVICLEWTKKPEDHLFFLK